MKLNNRFTIMLSILISFRAQSGDLRRISSTYKDLSTAQRVYLHAGLISVIEFPQNIIEVRVGNSKTVKVDLSQVSGKEMTLQLLNQNAKATNIIVKSEKKFYVFDIIPSKSSHQDFIKIRGAYGAPKFSETQKPTQTIKLGP